VLVAPPGTGKTTLVPPALLDEPWATSTGPGRILVAEPRRLAARSAARWVAAGRGEEVGGAVGYAVRGDRRGGAGTRIEYVTTGVLLRRLQRDPGLEGTAAVLLDEFHERSVEVDLALALLCDVRGSLRPDLRLVVMSATLDPGPVAQLLDAPVVTATAPRHPVDTRYRPGSAHDRPEDRVADVTLEALRSDDGDVLVFLPGRGEIRRTAAALAARPLPGGVTVHELHSSVPDADQDAALAPSRDGRRVVLATSIAETSITVPGVRVVVDAGRRRSRRSDPATGLPALRTGPVSRAGADQRRGRAGRTGPGVCYRLWSRDDERHRPAADVAEVVEGDLTTLLLEVLAWGAADVDELAWVDPPGPAAVAAARDLLADLGALDGHGRLNAAGRDLARLGVHPRLGAVARAAPADLAAAVAAVLEVDRPGDADLTERVRRLRGGAGDGDERAAEREWRARLRRRDAGTDGPGPDDAAIGRAVLAGYPDRVARRRDAERTDDRGRGETVYRLRTGGEVALPAGHPLARSEWLVVPGLDAGPPGRAGRVHLAVPVTAREVLDAAGAAITEEREVRWDRRAGDVRATRTRRLGAITLDRAPWTDPPADDVRDALAEGLAVEGPAAMFPRWAEAESLRARVELLRQAGVPCPDERGWPDPADPSALLVGARSRSDLARVDVAARMLDGCAWATRRALDELAPTRLTLPSGRTVTLRYALGPDGDPTVELSTRLQDLLGTDAHPTVAGGRVPVTVELLSPAGRPVQRTSDLPGFWRGSYAAVRADLRGRYPRHAWPERPWE
jgi:ATP-dependent helicase HrpB